MDVSELALRAQAAWFRTLAGSGFPRLRVGPDGFAVSTGIASNTENGAVIPPSVVDEPLQLDALLGWLRERAVPASVLVTGPLSPDAVMTLIDRGLKPERTGNDMGRLITDADADAAGADVARATEWQIGEVRDAQALRDGFGVYADDGWWDWPGALDQHVETATRLGFGPGRPIRHWVARRGGSPVGAASSFRFDDAVLLVQSCVAEPWRRQGIGTALARVRLAAAAADGAVRAVVFPSPDGYHLHNSLGFDLSPVAPDRCFYLP
jgi:GNAT superfamily N-acetyltransferase